jgi:hypothetical protein
MIVALTLTSVALAAKEFLRAAITHGMEHLKFLEEGPACGPPGRELIRKWSAITIRKESAMRKSVLGISAAALATSLAACGGTDQPENTIAAEEFNAMKNLEELPPVAPSADVVVQETVNEARQLEPAATKPAPAKPAATKPAPAKPASAKPKPEPAPEPQAPTCLPEHRAAGHC